MRIKRCVRLGWVALASIGCGLGLNCQAAGLVAGWGDDSFGQTTLPQGTSNIKALAGDRAYSLALRGDGTVVAWGQQNGSLATVPTDLARVKAIAVASSCALALRSDGTLAVWGATNSDATNSAAHPPPGLNSVIAVAARAYHALALKADGSVVAWGDNPAGPTNVPAGLTDVTAIAIGSAHSLALKSDGSVVAWGDNTDGQTTVPDGLSNVVAIAAGSLHSLALKADGTVAVWGANINGVGTVPPGLSNVTAIAAGYFHNLALKADGTVVAWGDNSFGQIAVPAGLTRVRGIAAGYYHSLAIVDDGPVQILQAPVSQMARWSNNAVLSVQAAGQAPLSYQWYFNGAPLTGSNVVSGIGGFTTDTLTFTNLQLSESGAYSVVVSNALGSMSSTGAVLTVYSPPVITQTPTGATVRAGSNYTFSAVAAGSQPISYQWFFNGTNVPGAIQSVLTVTNSQAGQAGNYFVQASNQYGTAVSSWAALGVIDSAPYIVQQPRSQTVPLGGVLSLSVDARGTSPLSYQWRFNGEDLAGATNAALTLNGTATSQSGSYSVLVSNSLGQVSSAKALVSIVQVYVTADAGPYAPTNVPASATNLVAVAAGQYHIVGLKADGSVVSWINDTFVQTSGAYSGLTNLQPNLNNVSAIAAGGTFSMALRTDGTVAAWGMSGMQTNVPRGLSNVVAIAAGLNSAMALQSNGGVQVWGTYYYGQTNVPAGLANVVGIAAGDNHCLALRADGRVVAWGDNTFGQTNVPPGLSNVIRVWGAGNGSLALGRNGTIAAWGSIPTNGLIIGMQNYGPIVLSNVVSLADNGAQGLALMANGTLRPFGNSPYLTGSSASLTNLANVAALAVGGARQLQGNFYVALMGDGSPAITLQPAIQTATPGANVTLYCRAAGVQPMSYQWQFNGVSLPGATNSSLSLTNVQAANLGGYRVVVANSQGVSISSTASLSLSQFILWSSFAGGNYAIPTNYPAGLNDLVALAPGDNHVLALRANGSVVSWGIPTNGLETGLPAGLNNVVAIAVVGSTQNLALTATGTLKAWGASPTMTNLPPGLSNVVAIASDHYALLALKSDGTVRSWNPFSPGGYYATPSISNIVAIASGFGKNLALDRFGRVMGWSYNTTNLDPAVPAGLSNVIAIAAGYDYSLALRAEGTVVCWGSPTNVFSGLTNVVAIAAGYEQGLALRADGSVVAQGGYISSVPAPAGNVTSIGLGGGWSTSFATVLTGNGSPALTVQPFDQTVNTGDTVQLHARAAGMQPIRYQWQLNGADLPGATNASLVLTNVQTRDVGSYRVVAANDLGAQVSRSAVVRTLVDLGVALNAPQLNWTQYTKGVAPWFGEVTQSHDGAAAAQSGHITDNQTSVLIAPVTGPGTLTFWWKVSSEEDFDFLSFTIDGISTGLSISGETGWQQVRVPVSAGAHTLQWTYSKDASVSDGQDAGWVDEVNYVPDAPVILSSPTNQIVDAGAMVSFRVQATGLTGCQWLKDGVALPGATNTQLWLLNVARSNSGVYAARVSNLGLSVLSSNATLFVRVPQRLSAPARLADGSFAFYSRDCDGGSLQPADLAGFQVLVSSNLVDWNPLTNALTITTNGALCLRDATNCPRRFYRLVERQP